MQSPTAVQVVPVFGVTENDSPPVENGHWYTREDVEAILGADGRLVLPVSPESPMKFVGRCRPCPAPDGTHPVGVFSVLTNRMDGSPVRILVTKRGGDAHAITRDGIPPVRVLVCEEASTDAFAEGIVHDDAGFHGGVSPVRMVSPLSPTATAGGDRTVNEELVSPRSADAAGRPTLTALVTSPRMEPAPTHAWPMGDREDWVSLEREPHAPLEPAPEGRCPLCWRTITEGGCPVRIDCYRRCRWWHCQDCPKLHEYLIDYDSGCLLHCPFCSTVASYDMLTQPARDAESELAYRQELVRRGIPREPWQDLRWDDEQEPYRPQGLLFAMLGNGIPCQVFGS